MINSVVALEAAANSLAPERADAQMGGLVEFTHSTTGMLVMTVGSILFGLLILLGALVRLVGTDWITARKEDRKARKEQEALNAESHRADSLTGADALSSPTMKTVDPGQIPTWQSIGMDPSFLAD